MLQNETNFKNNKLCDIDTRIKKNLIRLRMARNLTQRRLADLSGIRHIGQIESGHAHIGKRVVLKLAYALDVDPVEFFLPEEVSRNTLGEIMETCSGLSEEARMLVLDMAKSIAVYEMRLNWRE